MSRFSVLGKVRARGLDERTPKLMRALRRAGFCEQAADGVCVPEPLGVVEECHMWLQRKVAGSSAWPPLAGPGGTELAARVAEALVKLHEAGVPTRRRHGMQDELRILRERLEGLAARGIEVVTWAANDPGTSHRCGYEYLAVWKMPDEKAVKLFEEKMADFGIFGIAF